MLRLVLAARVKLHTSGFHGCRHSKEDKDEEDLHGGFVFTIAYLALMVFILLCEG